MEIKISRLKCWRRKICRLKKILEFRGIERAIPEVEF
jgi:hypothetical protein